MSQVPLIWTNNKSTHNSFSTALQRLIKSCISHTLAPHPISNPDRRHPAWTAARPPSSDSRVYEEQEPPTSIRLTVTSTSTSFIEVIERVILGDLRVTQNPAQLRSTGPSFDTALTPAIAPSALTRAQGQRICRQRGEVGVDIDGDLVNEVDEDQMENGEDEYIDREPITEDVKGEPIAEDVDGGPLGAILRLFRSVTCDSFTL